MALEGVASPRGTAQGWESAFGWRCRLRSFHYNAVVLPTMQSPPAQNGPCRHPATGADEPLVAATALLVPNVTDDRGRPHYRLLRTKSVIRVVNHDRCDLPSGVGLLHQVDDAGPLQFFSVGLATYGDAPGDHGGCAQPFEVKVDQLGTSRSLSPAVLPWPVGKQRLERQVSCRRRRPLG